MTEEQRMPWAVARETRETIRKLDESPALEGLPAIARPTMRPGDPIRFAVNVIAEPTSRQGKRGFLISPIPGWSGYEIFCDEGTPLGGTDEAPSPLGYLTSAIAFCMLTHITGYLHSHPMSVQSIKVEMRGKYWSAGTQDDSTGPTAGCDGFECCVLIDSDDDADKIEGMVDACRNACIAMQTIAAAVPAHTSLILNGENRGNLGDRA